jgi:hypothetical protein
MKRIAGLSIIAMLLSTPATAEDDNVLSTPPMFPGNQLQCLVANVGKTPVSLLIELFDQNGDVAFSGNCRLPPNAIDYPPPTAQCAFIAGAPAAGWCKFTVTFGKKRDLRAAICSIDINLGPGAAPSCLSAQ